MAESNSKGSKSSLEKFAADVSKNSAIKRVLIGGTSGWFTGFVTVRFGKAVSLAAAGGVLILYYAHEKGYIDINWDRIGRKLDKVSEKLEDKITGEEPSWSVKAERFVDKNIGRVEKGIKKQQHKVKRWYSGLLEDRSKCQITNAQIFIVSYVAGVALGMASFR